MPNSLKWKLLLPIAVCGLLMAAYTAWGWLPSGISSATRVSLALSLLWALAVLLVVANVAINRLVVKPLAALCAASPASTDTIPAVQATIAALNDTLAQQRTDLANAVQRCRLAESALQSSEERYALALRASNDGLWEWHLQSGTMDFSPRWKSMLGFTEGELHGTRQAWRLQVHADDLPQVEQAIDNYLAGSTPCYEQQLRMVHKDGTTRWVLSRGTAIRHASGKPYRMVGLDTDVTSLRRMESILDAIVAGTTGAYGETFFRTLVRHFAAALEVPCAFITECADYPPSRLRTLAFWSSSSFLDNFEYDLPGTPCETVVKEGRTCFHPRTVGTIFPCEAGYEGYLGIPIFASHGKVIGHLAFLDTKEMTEAMLVDSMYRIFTARAGAEIERIAAMEQLQLRVPSTLS